MTNLMHRYTVIGVLGLSATIGGCGREPAPASDPAQMQQGSDNEDLNQASCPLEAEGTGACSGLPDVVSPNGCSEAGNYAEYNTVGDETALHVVGIYESRSDHDVDSHPTGEVTIRLEKAGPAVLVLSSYEPTHWRIEVGEKAELKEVILNGYHAQSADVPGCVPVTVHSYEQTGDLLGGEFPWSWPSYAGTSLVDAAESATGLQLTSFRGCYRSDYFVIGEGSLTPPKESLPGPDIFPGCEAIAAESAYCMALVSGETTRLMMVGLDSGTTCAGPSVDINAFGGSGSLAWSNGYVYSCIPELALARISTGDGSLTLAPIRCEAVTTGPDGSLLVLSVVGEDTLQAFASFEDVLNGQPAHTYKVANNNSRIAYHDGQLYSAWHSTSTVQVAPLDDLFVERSIPLADFDDWVWGLDATDAGDLIVATAWGEELRIFDAQTGAARASFALDFGLDAMSAGISCTSK